MQSPLDLAFTLIQVSRPWGLPAVAFDSTVLFLHVLVIFLLVPSCCCFSYLWWNHCVYESPLMWVLYTIDQIGNQFVWINCLTSIVQQCQKEINIKRELEMVWDFEYKTKHNFGWLRLGFVIFTCMWYLPPCNECPPWTRWCLYRNCLGLTRNFSPCWLLSFRSQWRLTQLAATTIGRRDQETHGWPSNQCLSGTIAEEWTQSSCGPAGEKQVREGPKETMEQAGRPEGQPAGASGIAGLASKDKGR